MMEEFFENHPLVGITALFLIPSAAIVGLVALGEAFGPLLGTLAIIVLVASGILAAVQG